jgi:murein DD-endopeptidase MepM/ murein hydrolase activator NlpD
MMRKRIARRLTALVAVGLASGIFTLAWAVSRHADRLGTIAPPPAIGAVTTPALPAYRVTPLDRPPPGDQIAAAAFAGALEDVAVEELQARRLTLPVSGIAPDALTGSFDDRRGSHRHEAIDILAPRHTPVLAVEDGTIARLFFSDAGGMTVYHFDPTNRYAYYYAHLDRYAAGLTEKSAVRRGQVLGYVGTSGNAPEDTPHLHFAIFKLTERRRWWEGTPLDPYPVLTGSD